MKKSLVLLIGATIAACGQDPFIDASTLALESALTGNEVAFELRGEGAFEWQGVKLTHRQNSAKTRGELVHELHVPAGQSPVATYQARHRIQCVKSGSQAQIVETSTAVTLTTVAPTTTTSAVCPDGFSVATFVVRLAGPANTTTPNPAYNPPLLSSSSLLLFDANGPVLTDGTIQLSDTLFKVDRASVRVRMRQSAFNKKLFHGDVIVKSPVGTSFTLDVTVGGTSSVFAVQTQPNVEQVFTLNAINPKTHRVLVYP